MPHAPAWTPAAAIVPCHPDFRPARARATTGENDGPMSHEPVRAPRGSQRSCKGWAQEAAMRMLMNNLDPEVAEHPDQLIVYGGSRRAPPSRGAHAPLI